MKQTLFYKIKNYIPFLEPFIHHTRIDEVGFTLIDRTNQKCKCESTILHIEEINLQLVYPEHFICVRCFAWNYEKKKVYDWTRPITIYDEED